MFSARIAAFHGFAKRLVAKLEPVTGELTPGIRCTVGCQPTANFAPSDAGTRATD
jgi:hypothetical protein